MRHVISMNFELLLERLKRGDEQAFRELVMRLSKRLMTVARIYTNSDEDAKDVLQDAFILVFKKIKIFEGSEEGAMYGWIKRIIINLCLNRNQKKFRRQEKKIEDLKIDKPVPEVALNKMAHDEIMEYIFNLPDDYRKVFSLYAIEGYSHKEIAELMQITETNSRTHLHRSRKILQANIQMAKKLVII